MFKNSRGFTFKMSVNLFKAHFFPSIKLTPIFFNKSLNVSSVKKIRGI